jgi:hypothetical protein
MAIKLTITAEPTGSEKATLKMTTTGGGEERQEQTVRESTAGTTAAVSSEVFEMEEGGKLEIEVTKVIELKYDKDQATMVEVPEAETKARKEKEKAEKEAREKKEGAGAAAHGPKSHSESGAKEANATHESRPKR